MGRGILTGGLILTLLVTGCTQPSVESPVSVPVEGGKAIPENGTTIIEGREREPADNVSGPVLSSDLIRDTKPARRSGGFDNAGLSIGETAVDFTLKDTNGNTISLRGLLSEKPVVMVFGSFT